MPTKRGHRQPHERSDGVVTRHEAAIRALLAEDPHICRNGFVPAVTALWDRLQIEVDEPGDDHDPCPQIDFRPDAYLIDEEAKQLIIFEVEDWGPLRHDKRISLGRFWFRWDADDRHDWLPRLLMVNRYGMITHEIPMASLWLEGIRASNVDRREAIGA